MTSRWLPKWGRYETACRTCGAKPKKPCLKLSSAPHNTLEFAPHIPALRPHQGRKATYPRQAAVRAAKKRLANWKKHGRNRSNGTQ